ncbi:hypothetical protein [Streptomyces lavendofoliae]|uniref:Uncharacterized protein n=1 Tax=Streptomyces lavendofoliae TaxID=67314 RepID=A0A918I4N9_9ACTN|nr:hypothetical protein [Streptomyces lavendofoliae]GGU63488.1 hypothetical protein GCM10010274_60340 [Streptomyces lavendofoliae]
MDDERVGVDTAGLDEPLVDGAGDVSCGLVGAAGEVCRTESSGGGGAVDTASGKAYGWWCLGGDMAQVRWGPIDLPALESGRPDGDLSQLVVRDPDFTPAVAANVLPEGRPRLRTAVVQPRPVYGSHTHRDVRIMACGTAAEHRGRFAGPGRSAAVRGGRPQSFAQVAISSSPRPPSSWLVTGSPRRREARTSRVRASEAHGVPDRSRLPLSA